MGQLGTLLHGTAGLLPRTSKLHLVVGYENIKSHYGRIPLFCTVLLYKFSRGLIETMGGRSLPFVMTRKTGSCIVAIWLGT